MSHVEAFSGVDISRRSFLAGAGTLAAGLLLANDAKAADVSIGNWSEDAVGLPCYHYTGPLEFSESLTENGVRLIPNDPVFLLGNYRLTLFVHASGRYQLMTGERAWGRMNAGDEPWSGANAASVAVNGENHELIGVDAAAAKSAEKHFGVGFARFEYSPTPQLRVTRRLSVVPSENVRSGTSAFLVEVALKNTDTSTLNLSYRESVRARYQQAFAKWDEDQTRISWSAHPATINENLAFVNFETITKEKTAIPPEPVPTHFEAHPPALGIVALSDALKFTHQNNDLAVLWSGTLKPNEERVIRFVVGYSRDTNAVAFEKLAADLTHGAPLNTVAASAFANDWRKKIPAFKSETNPTLRREMQWNVAALEAMATWREYYNETVIPQGTDYDYKWGWMGGARDLFQHALPLCHTNPALARSVLRYNMKRTTQEGEIKMTDQGWGWSPSSPQQTSDQQLFFFLLLAEYLRVTHDSTILNETIEYYPCHSGSRGTGVTHVRDCFLYLRERIGVGAHGIIKRWNSDWNDMFFYWPTTTPYNNMFEEGESHMNSAMAIVLLGELSALLDTLAGKESAELVVAMHEYRTQLLEAWMDDMDGRSFPRRCWTSATQAIGESEMWLEPQGFALLIPEFPRERKQQLWNEVKTRLLKNETIGPRQIETPVQQPGTPAGTRENGGFWYALAGPLILGLLTFDKASAGELIERMTFSNFAARYPNYWTGQWTASDSLDSSLVPSEGLSELSVWCAHAHAWPLYCWLRWHGDGAA